MAVVVKTKSDEDNLCKYCQMNFATCPKANHIRFGSGKGNDNIIECSEFVVRSYFNNYPIEGTRIHAEKFVSVGIRYPEMRYAGYKGHPMKFNASDDEKAAYLEGVEARG